MQQQPHADQSELQELRDHQRQMMQAALGADIPPSGCLVAVSMGGDKHATLDYSGHIE